MRIILIGLMTIVGGSHIKRHSFIQIALLTSLSLILLGCAPSTYSLYKTHTTSVALGNSSYEVSFVADNASREVAADFIAIRSAESTIADGYGYFVIDDIQDLTTEGSYIIPATSTTSGVDTPIYGIFTGEYKGSKSAAMTVYTSEKTVVYDKTNIVATILAFNKYPKEYPEENIYASHIVYDVYTDWYGMSGARIDIPYHGWIGELSFSNLSSVNARAIGIPKEYASPVLARKVPPSSSAYISGLRTGDVILWTRDLISNSTVHIEGDSGFTSTVADSKPGRKLYIGIQRQGKIRELSIPVYQKPRPVSASSDGWIGVTMKAPDKELLLLAGIPEEYTSPVLITTAIKGLPAHSHGLRKGDIVVAVNDRPLNGTSDFIETIQKTNPGGVLKLRLLRGGIGKTIRVTVAAAPYDPNI